MNIIADQNIYDPSIAVLRSAGHDVLSIREKHPGMLDPDILALAVETERVLVTRDRDFGELAFLRRLPTPPAIIYIRLRHVRLDAYGVLLAGFLEREGDRLFGNFVALTADGERWRSLTAP